MTAVRDFGAFVEVKMEGRESYGPEVGGRPPADPLAGRQQIPWLFPFWRLAFFLSAPSYCRIASLPPRWEAAGGRAGRLPSCPLLTPLLFLSALSCRIHVSCHACAPLPRLLWPVLGGLKKKKDTSTVRTN